MLQRGPVGDPSQTQDACFFSEKVETAQLLGYDAVIIANHHSGALGGEGRDTHLCGGHPVRRVGLRPPLRRCDG